MQTKIIFATNNQHKLYEVQNLLGEHFQLVSLKEIGFNDDIPETKPTLEGNAVEKARHIYIKYKMPCFADDTGLEVEALNGAPGVHSARYSGNLASFPSEKARSEANIDKLLTNMHGKENRKARFRTVIAFIHEDKQHLFEGIVSGEIINQRQGQEGFGYDPVFVPEGYRQTFAEMPLPEKNQISHRARAFAKFVEFLKNQNI